MKTKAKFILQMRKDEEHWCLALRGNHDEHQCHKKPGHLKSPAAGDVHECYCGVWW